MLVKGGFRPSEKSDGLRTRKILHIDMDAFFASVEQRDFPELRGRPVVVGGNPKGRGVVAAASYEARRFGIRSAMPAALAWRKCPEAVFRKPRFEVYKAVSLQIREIFGEYTDLIEPLSLDEAYLDVTENFRGNPSATLVASEIRSRIRAETGLTASAGVAFNKFLAKTASDRNKPDGQFVITPDEAESFLEELEIGCFFGVGKATAARMHALGIFTGGDLKKWDETELARHFGKHGHHYYRIVRGIDNREVRPDRIRKSVGKERTFPEDIGDRDRILEILAELSERVAENLERLDAAGKTVTLKVRYRNFETVTRSSTLGKFVREKAELAQIAAHLLDETEAGTRKVRLLGVAVSSLDLENPGAGIQLEIRFRGNHQD